MRFSDIKGAIFDLDGTLLDSMWLWDVVGSSYLKKLGIEPEPDLDNRFKSMSMDESTAYLKERYGLTLSHADIMQQIDQFVASYYNSVFTVKPGVVRLLDRLQELGVEMCVASLTNGYLVEAALARNQISQYFSGVFSCRDLGISKHEPQIYLIAQEHLGLDRTQVAVFEDAPFAINTAKNAGFIVVGVNDPSYKENIWERRQWADYFVENNDFIETLGI